MNTTHQMMMESTSSSSPSLAPAIIAEVDNAALDSTIDQHMVSSNRLTVTNSSEAASCHQCKSRRLLTELHYCSHMPAPRRQCRKKFCDGCLEKFYDDAMPIAGKETKWKCPSCMGFCCCAACVRRLYPESRPIRRRPYEQTMNMRMLHTLNDDPVVAIDNGARALLYSVSQHQTVQKRILQYAAMNDASEPQRISAIVSLLSQVAFPDAWTQPKMVLNFPMDSSIDGRPNA